VTAFASHRRVSALTAIACAFGCSASGHTAATGGDAAGSTDNAAAPIAEAGFTDVPPPLVADAIADAIDGGDAVAFSGPSSFMQRCSAPGIVRCFGFDAEGDVRPHLDPAADGMYHGQVVSDVVASGAGSLRFEVPSQSAANTSGEFWLDFADDFSVTFGEGEEFYVQWRQRFSPAFLSNQYAGGEGWKQVIIGTASRPGAIAYSCTDLEVVTIDNYYRGFPEMYHSCGVKDGQYEGLEEPSPPSDYFLENGIRNPGCMYRSHTSPPCHGYQSDQWITFQVHIKIGTWYKNDHVYRHDSTVQLWVADEGQPSQLVVDFSPHDPACAAQQVSEPSCQTGYDLVNPNPSSERYGKVWLLPYNTNKDSTQSYPVAYTWYDELVISRNKIADPF
jgi:hypothetical protein